jgi:internalin A
MQTRNGMWPATLRWCFSLLLNVVAGGVCRGGEELIDREQTAMRLRELGAEMSVDQDEGGYSSVTLRGPKVTDEALALLAAFAEIRSLSIAYQNRITDDGLEHLARLKRLEQLTLHADAVTGRGLKHLGALPELGVVHLYLNALDEEQSAGIGNLSNVWMLSLHGRLSDGALAHLKPLSKLNRLSLQSHDSPQAAGPNVSGAGLRHLRDLPSLESLSLTNLAVSDEDLHELPNVTSLSLYKLDVTDSGLETLARMEDLRALRITAMPITDDGLARLAGLRNLTALGLGGTKVTDDGLKHLIGWTELKNISLTNNPALSGTGLKHLPNPAGVGQLTLYGAGVSDEGLASLRGFTGVTHLSIGGPHPTRKPLERPGMSDASLVHLRAMDRLAYLEVVNSGITDAGLQQLAALPALVSINIWDSPGVTNAGLESLKEARPRLQARAIESN